MDSLRFLTKKQREEYHKLKKKMVFSDMGTVAMFLGMNREAYRQRLYRMQPQYVKVMKDWIATREQFAKEVKKRFKK